MINLLPLLEKTRVRNEYLGRISVVSLFFLFSMILIGGILLIPLIVSSSNKKMELEEKLAVIKTTIAKDANRSSETIKDFRSRLSVLNRKIGADQTPSQIFEKIIFEKTLSQGLLAQVGGEGVRLNGLSYEKTADKTGFFVRVNGEASDRKSLLNFVKALQDDGGWKEVKVPVSDFAKGKNLEFSLEITI